MKWFYNTKKGLINEVYMLSQAVIAGKWDTRGNAGKFKGGYKEIVDEINKTLDAVIAPLNVAAEYVDRISKGDIPPKITDTYNGDFNEIKNNLNACIDGLGGLVEGNAILQRMSNNDLTKKVEGHYLGIYSKIAEGINLVNDRVAHVTEVVNNIGIGDFKDLSIVKKMGKKSENDKLTPSMIGMMENIIALTNETEILSNATINGKLDIRADVNKFEGEYKKVIAGVNNTLDAVIGPLNVAAEYVDRISKGDIPPKITDIYNGDFNEIKNNLNACIDGLGGLVEGDAILQRMSNNDLTKKVEGHYLGVYSEIAEGINLVRDRVAHTIEILNNIGIGDFKDLSILKEVGKRSENDKLIPAFIGTMENIKALTNETEILSNAAVEGKLDTRGDISKFKGEYVKVIDGINRTLDSVIKPVKEATAVLQQMANGNLKVKVKGDFKGDHADIKNALNDTIDSLASYVTEISEVLDEMSNSNLELSINNEYKGDFAQIKDALNLIIQSYNEVFTEINNAADQVSSGSNQVSDGSQALSQGTTEQASSIEELTASITEVAAQTKQNAVNASQANELALSAKDGATLGNSHMKEMLKSMDEINESSSNISKIIKVIDDIAFQTNMLALNAAVEAARAGQHGKGFAVVAEEVRNLAARSAKAAKETADLVEGSIKKVEFGTKIANNTAESLDQIVLGVSKAATLVGEIAAASNEQATAISQINKGIEQVSDVVQTNSATAEQSAAASEELSSQASMLKNMVGKFRLARDTSVSDNEVSLGSQRNPNQVKNKSLAHAEAAATKNKPRISLSNKDFGKY
ncbi:MAG TPA: methyl-accepting chemotaxis protein [Ruminiclostridium sp.]